MLRAEESEVKMGGPPDVTLEHDAAHAKIKPFLFLFLSFFLPFLGKATLG